MDMPVTQEVRAEEQEAGRTPQVSVIVPAYNEEQGVAGALQDLRGALAEQPIEYEIVVVDDGSTDRTAEIVAALAGVRLVRHRGNRGYGASLKTGIREAQGEIIVITDADGTYPPEYIPRMVEMMQEADMVVGARTGEEVRVPPLRKPAKWFLNRLASYLAQRRIPDLNSGLRAFRKREVLPLFGILPGGFSFTTTITLAMMCSDLRVEYMPIDYRKREGRSKIRPIPDTAKFLLLVLRTICLFNPLRVFLPTAVVLLVGGLVKLVWNVVNYHNIADLEALLMLAGLQVGFFGLLADMVARLRRIGSTG